jgi:hypothetical protein
VGLRNRATLFEYNAAGHLLGWRPATSEATYYCMYTETAFVEGRIGYGSNRLSTHYGTTPLTLEPDVDYAFFKCQMFEGFPDGNWMKAIEGEDYVILNGKAHWNLSSAQWHCQIRNNKHFLTYYIDNDAQDGLLVFSIQANEEDPFAPANRVLEIPPGKLDIFLNGRPLIWGIDATLKWPQVVVWNKRYLVDGPVQRLVIRGTGLPEMDESGKFVLQQPIDKGFVSWGQISRNGR